MCSDSVTRFEHFNHSPLPPQKKKIKQKKANEY